MVTQDTFADLKAIPCDVTYRQHYHFLCLYVVLFLAVDVSAAHQLEALALLERYKA